MQRILKQLLHILNMDNWLCVCVLVGLQVACCFGYDGKRSEPPHVLFTEGFLALGSAASKFSVASVLDCGH